MSIQLNGTNGIQFNDGSNMSSANQLGWRNRLINGDMRVDQRNAGASVTPASGPANTYMVDRWAYGYSQNSKMSMQQSSTAPDGFTNSFLFTSLSAYSVVSGDYFLVNQPIEGLNCADLGWGTANAQAVTVSFRVRSSLTGTFGGSLRNSASDRSYPFTYTVNSANTWETKTVTIPGDTTGTWLTTNGIGIRLTFGLGAGSTFSGTAGAWSAGNYPTATGATSVVGTNGATFYITGVQLEKGSVSTPYEYIDFSEQLRRCQRYYYRMKPASGARFGIGQCTGTTSCQVHVNLPTTMRSAPTMPDVSGTASVFRVLNAAGSGVTSSSAPTLAIGDVDNCTVTFTVASGLVGGDAALGFSHDGTPYLGFSAEL